MQASFQFFYLIVIMFCVNVSYCQRRIVGMNITTVRKRYMVYLVQSKHSHPRLNAWLCGGALVTTDKILTSAACLVTATNIFVVAGYRKYVSTDNLDKDNCTRATRRKVIKICVPYGRSNTPKYNFDPSDVKTWMTLDIGVAVVDRPYLPNDYTFNTICDYKPTPIPILYHKYFTYDDQDVLAFGWGFKRGRRPEDPLDYNYPTLQYASYRMTSYKQCKKAYEGMEDVIKKYMLCARVPGFMDDGGRLLLYKNDFTECRRRGGSDSGNGGKCSDSNLNEAENHTAQMEARRQLVYNYQVEAWGICQNDHGGPLIVYIGRKEMIIGVAVITVYDTSYNCIGPALFTSTACTSSIIQCMLANANMRRSYTDALKQEGFGIHERHIEWPEESSDDSNKNE